MIGSSLPVKATLATSGCSTSGAPTSAPKPVTTLTTPGGKPAASTSFMNSRAEADVNSDGLITIVLPAASAGAVKAALPDSPPIRMFPFRKMM